MHFDNNFINFTCRRVVRLRPGVIVTKHKFFLSLPYSPVHEIGERGWSD